MSGLVRNLITMTMVSFMVLLGMLLVGFIAESAANRSDQRAHCLRQALNSYEAQQCR